MKKCLRTYILIFFLAISAFINSQNAEIDTLLARSQRLLSPNSDSSLKLAFNAAELSQEKKSDSYLSKSFSAIADFYSYFDDYDKTIIYYEKALDAAVDLPDDKEKAKLFHKLGKTYYNKGNYDKCVEYLNEAKKLASKLNDDEVKYLVYSSMGSVYSNMTIGGNADSSKKYYSLALKLALAGKDSIRIADSYRRFNVYYGQIRDFKTALLFLDTAITIYNSINYARGLAYAYKDIGDILYYQKEFTKATDYYQKAYEINKKENNLGMLSTNACDVAYMYAMEKKIDLFNKYADESYKLAKQTNSWADIKYVSRWLSEAYEMVGDDKKSLFYSKLHFSINDSINNRERIEKNSRTTAQNTFEEKIKLMKDEEDKRNAIAEEKTKYQSFIRNILIGGILIACILLFITYRSFVQKQKANVIISKQKEEVELQKLKIEEKNKEITDSINYAKLIQKSILPDPVEILNTFPDCFGLYLPKDVVSGDFYWYHKNGDFAMIAAADCTGHGVPGALMSMIGIDKLNLAVSANNLTNPGEILSFVNKGLKTTLKQNLGTITSQDGMDIALCCFNFKEKTVHFSGANRPLWIIRNKEIIEYKPTKAAIGGNTDNEQVFTDTKINLQKNDSVYIFSDGYADQFGGGTGKKMMTKNFKELLISIQTIPIKEQEKILLEQLKKWQGTFEQVDDILIIGIRV